MASWGLKGVEAEQDPVTFFVVTSLFPEEIISSVYVCVCVCEYICVCVCMCVMTEIHKLPGEPMVEKLRGYERSECTILTDL